MIEATWTPIARRRSALRLLAVGIVVFSIFVLVQANRSVSLGFQLLGTTVHSVQPETQWLGPAPAPGDQLRQLGPGPEINSWPHFLNVRSHLWERPFAHEPRKVGDASELRADGGHWAALAADGGRWVRAKFERPGAGVFETWLRIRQGSWRKLYLSLLWAFGQSAVVWMGWLVFRRKPADDAAALFFLCCLLTVGAYLGGHHWLDLASEPALLFPFALAAMALPQISLHFYLRFPAPNPWAERRPRTTWALVYGLPCALQIAILAAVGSVVSTFRADHAADLGGRLAVLQTLLWAYAPVATLLYVGCVAAVFQSFRSAREPGQRDQMRWLAAGAALASVFFGVAMWRLLADPVGFVLGDATWPMFGGALAFTAAHAVGLARYRLADVETAVRRGRVYLFGRFTTWLLYYGALFALALAAPRLATGDGADPLLFSTALVVGLLIANAVRGAALRWLDRRFFREKRLFDRAVRRLQRQEGGAAGADAWRRLLAAAAEQLNASGAAAYALGPDGSLRLVDRMGAGEFPEEVAAASPVVAALRAGSGLLRAAHGPIFPADRISPELRRLGMELVHPVAAAGDFAGALFLGPRDDGQYEADDLHCLASLTEVAALALEHSVARAALERDNETLRARNVRFARRQEQADEARRAPAPDAGQALHGRALATRELVGQVAKVAASSATVLLRGESGTGKTLLAERLHRLSPRAAGPFVTVHCAMLAGGVLESELFGHVKGAFTGAIRDKIGRFEQADGGTIFLDEIGDVDMAVQTKLLRVLQERTFEPVGGTQPKTVDVRIVAATHQKLEELIRVGRFREDLFYRLNVVALTAPPLRDRQEDIVELAMHFLQRAAQRLGKDLEAIDPAALEALHLHHWPGNVRELENVVERAAVLADGPVVGVQDLPPEIAAHADGADLPMLAADRTRRVAPGTGFRAARGLAGEIEALERQRLLDALATAGGNKSQAARALGYRRTTYCSKLRKHGIE